MGHSDAESDPAPESEEEESYITYEECYCSMCLGWVRRHINGVCLTCLEDSDATTPRY